MLERENQETEQGFVLATSLVMLSLMTLLAIAMYFNSKSAIQISGSAQHSTEGRYYAETGANYMIWAKNNDAEFDSYSAIVARVGGFSEPALPSVANNGPDAATVGDTQELEAKVWDPGPTVISDTSGAGTSGQVMYFDNTPMAGRAICIEYVDTTSVTDPFPNCINLFDSPTNRFAPTLYHISSNLPRYIVLEISSSGVITPSIPVLPHPAVPVVGTDVPNNGAIVWLTTGNSLMDFEVDPSLGCTGTIFNGTVVLANGTVLTDVMGCDKNKATSLNTTGWLRAVGDTATYPKQNDQYGVIVYSIGYVNGRPSSIIRAQIR